MKISEKIKKILMRSCVLFTVLSVSSYALTAIFSGKLNGWIPSLYLILVMLAMSVAICASSSLLTNEKISAGLRIPVHFATLGVCFYLAFVVGKGKTADGGFTLIALFLYAILYALSVGAYFIIRGAKKKKKNRKAEYHSMFGGE